MRGWPAAVRRGYAFRVPEIASIPPRRLVATTLVPLILTGCGAVQDAVAPDASALSPTPLAANAASGGTVDPAVLQAAAIGLGDEIIEIVAAATDRIEDRTTNIALRSRAHQLKLQTARGIVNTVAGSNSIAALIDLATVTTLMHEAAMRGSAAEFGDDAPQLVDALGRARIEAIETLDDHVAPDRVADLDAALRNWRFDERDLIYVSQVRLRDFENIRRQGEEGSDGSSGGSRVTLLSLLALDPLASLDPTTREFQKARLLGERAFYQAQRTSLLVRWEIEGLLYDIAATPEAVGLLADVGTAVGAADRTALTLESLPEYLAAERSAALVDIEAAVARQRDETVRQVQAAAAAEREALVRELQALPETVGATGDAASPGLERIDAAASSLEGALRAFDDVLVRMGVDPDTPPAPEDPDAEPFRMADVGVAAERIEGAARELTTTLSALERVLDTPVLTPADPDAPSGELAAVSSVRDAGTSLIDRAFGRGIILILIATIGLGTAIAIGRRLGGPRG